MAQQATRVFGLASRGAQGHAGGREAAIWGLKV